MTSKKNHQLHSMTGFGKANINLTGFKANWEIRTLNSRNIDINIKLDSQLRPFELTLRKIIQEGLHRGKVDVSLALEPIGSKKENASVEEAFDKRLETMMAMLGKHLGKKGDLSTDMAWQLLLKEDLWNASEEGMVWQDEDVVLLQKSLEEAIAQTMEFRRAEGEQIHAFLDQELGCIEGAIPEVEQQLAERSQLLREGLERHMQEINDLDANRFEQEVLYYLDKWDVTEELVRLSAHCAYFRTTMDGGKTTGKKLQFITQEIGREINTLGSKASFAPIQHLVVNMKENLEKIKEQLANVL
jgi:uncharacterized protein (TIGR00255 family)